MINRVDVSHCKIEEKLELELVHEGKLHFVSCENVQ